MEEYSVFDVIGPVMVGPSSSHTAGAARIGRIARNILGSEPDKVHILLHGSFAATYKGHGTDRALVGGILGMEPHDPSIREALQIARKKGIELVIQTGSLGDFHPNTARISLESASGERVEVIGASVGGGRVKITQINGFTLEMSGEYTTMVAVYDDRPGMVAKVSGVLAQYQVNIAFMRVSRRSSDRKALMVVETDQSIPPEAVHLIEDLIELDRVKVIAKSAI